LQLFPTVTLAAGNPFDQSHNAAANVLVFDLSESANQPNGGGGFQEAEALVDVFTGRVITRSALKEKLNWYFENFSDPF
jgi:hypothetical protein